MTKQQKEWNRGDCRVLSFGIDISVDENVDADELAWVLKNLKLKETCLNLDDIKHIQIIGVDFKEDLTDEYLENGWVL